jgi:SAM-dependent methyltransferase
MYHSYGRVIGADLSPTMLEETRRRCREEGIEVPELVRCDSARLPFESNSIDAVHAGAAMHCWPRLSESLADVYRVLKPGGVFYSSTFFVSSIFERASRRMGSTGFYLFESKEEIEDFVSKAGFSGSGGACVVRKEGRGCAIIKAMKAPLPTPDDEGLLADLFSGKAADNTVGVDESTDEAL